MNESKLSTTAAPQSRRRHRWSTVVSATAVSVVVTLAVGAPVLACDRDNPPFEPPSDQIQPEPADAAPAPAVSEAPAPEAPSGEPAAQPTTSEPTTSEPTTSEPTTSEPATSEPAAETTVPTTVPESVETGAQAVDATIVQVAAADTGGNLAVGATTGSPGAAASGSANLSTGGASAVGSQDTTTVEQQAAVQLTGQASATVNQITIVFNLGAAAANSGTNSINAGTPSASGGAIATGNAVAVGNDATSLVTQAASGQAGPNQVDQVAQHSVTMQIGVATSATGANTIVATISTSGGGTIATGDANAIGNSSATSVEQAAIAIGSGTAQITIDQTATVVNFGAALADSGSNQLGAALAGAIGAGDTDQLETLLAILLPLLVASGQTGGTGGGGGTISTGNATAVGNQSVTSVQQMAVALTDSGQVHIDQHATVVNAGVAFATTGGNSIALLPPTAPGAVDAETLAVVGQVTAFMSQILAAIDAWSQGDTSITGVNSLLASLQGSTVSLDSSITASELAAVGNGTSSTVRQLTAVITMALAAANSGDNATSIETGPELSVAIAPNGDESVAVTITTGDANAQNSSVLVVCQLDDIEFACQQPDTGAVAPSTGQEPPRPTTPVQPAPVADISQPTQVGIVDPTRDVGAAAATPRQLATTGADVEVWLIAAVLTMLGGGLLLLGSRRRLTP